MVTDPEIAGTLQAETNTGQAAETWWHWRMNAAARQHHRGDCAA